MTFKIETGAAEAVDAPATKSSLIDGSINLASQPEWAERAHRQIIEAIQMCETLDAVHEYWRGETMLLDAFFMNYPEYWERIKEAYEDQRIFTDPKSKLPYGDTDPAANSLGIKF